MAKNTGFNVLRWIVFFLNLLFWLAGLGVVGVGLWLRLDPTVAELSGLDADTSSQPIDLGLNREWRRNFNLSSNLLILAGAFMSLIGFLGCCGAWRMHQCMLVGFFLVLTIVFCLEVTCAMVAYVHQDSIRKYVDNSMHEIVRTKYGQTNNPKYQKIFDRIQTDLECCGVRSYKDWLHSSWSTGHYNDKNMSNYGHKAVPTSCCNENGLREYPEDCGMSFDKLELDTYKSFLHQKGCSEALYQAANKNLQLAIAVSVALGSVQLLGIFFSMLLCCCIGRNEDKERDKEKRKTEFSYYTR
uniref:Tetraspanin n=1 Tax=Ditylenchus dipsaci TaxID=166011 RepID=A0A915CSB8_9BILA